MDQLKTAFAWTKKNWLAVLVVGFIAHSFLGPRPSFPVEPLARGGGYDMAEEGSAPQALSSRSFSSKVASFAADILPPVQAAGFDPSQSDRKIIKNGSLQLEVNDPTESKVLAEEEVTALKGLVTHGNSWEVRPGILAYNLTIRVPSGSFETLIGNLSELGVKKSENFSTNDITESYNDTAAQIKNLETRRTRLRKLLEFETKNLNDVLSVDRELNNVQQQIERLQRTQSSRDGQVDFSTLQLTINPETQIGDINNPHWNLGTSWKKSVNDLIASSQKIVDGVFKIVVYTPLWLPILLLILWWRRRK